MAVNGCGIDGSLVLRTLHVMDSGKYVWYASRYTENKVLGRIHTNSVPSQLQEPFVSDVLDALADIVGTRCVLDIAKQKFGPCIS